jgi:hypothetical protein
MSNATPRTLQLVIQEDDAGLLLVALWMRTREAANRSDYKGLRERVMRQLRSQGVDAGSEHLADEV